MYAFDPEHHHRRARRLKGHDYAGPGQYFLTFNTHQRQRLSGTISLGKIELSAFGMIADECWRSIPEHFQNVSLDEHMVMPDHVHGIIILGVPKERATQCVAPVGGRPTGPKPGSIGAIIGAYRSIVSRRINVLRNSPGADVWQRDYHDWVSRDPNALELVRAYIRNNPAKH